MSGIEIAASIIGIAGAGFRLSLILNAVSCEIANAPAEIHAISKSVTLFSLLLKQTAAVLQQADSVHSQEALRTSEQVIDESHAVFNEINTMLDRVRTKRSDGTVSPSIPQRIKWCFKKHGIEYLLGRIDRLQMSLSLMLQIIQLGTSMASTSRNDPPERVREMTERIKRERVEAQNVVVLYFFENQQLERLYLTAREEATEAQSPIEFCKDESDALTLVASNDSSESTKVEALPLYSKNGLNIQPPARVLRLADIDPSWTNMGKSPEDMIKCSDQVIDRLLDWWTVWRQRRDQQLREPRSTYGSRYRSEVQDLHDDEDPPIYDTFQERDSSPNAKLLEGPTTDWRKPNSGEARRETARRRRAYKGYQPSVSQPNSDVEDSSNSTGSKKRPTKKHIINSDSESSETDQVGERAKPRRRSSAVAMPTDKSRFVQEPATMSKSYSAMPSGLATPQASQSNAKPTISPTYSQYHPQRPFMSPDQRGYPPSFSSPLPNQFPHGGGYTYSPPPQGVPQSPNQFLGQSPQNYPFPQPSQTRYMPPHLASQPPQQSQHRPAPRDGPQRPYSRDGKPARSPSRLSREYTTSDYKRYEEQRKRERKEMRRNIGDGAAKGLLAGGGLAVLLEALDAF